MTHHFYDARRHAVHHCGDETSTIVVRFIERTQDPFNPNDGFVCEHMADDGYTYIHRYILAQRLDVWRAASAVQVWAAVLNVVETLEGEILMNRGGL